MVKNLKDFFKENETVIGEHYFPSVPLYFDSLRHGFDFFFKTFRTNNSMYEWYAFPLSGDFFQDTAESKKKIEKDSISRDFTDDDNFLLAIVSFQRFFELFLKDVLKRVDERLILKSSNAKDFVSAISGNGVIGKHRIEAGEALLRFEALYSKKSETGDLLGDLLPNFINLKGKYEYLSNESHIETIGFLNEWRNRLLHGGLVFPNLRAFDYFVSKRVVPLIKEVLKSEEELFLNTQQFFYLEPLSGIDLLTEIESIEIDIIGLEKFPLSEKTSWELLRLGHLKEIGRANMNMNLYVRLNHAGYEYNYRDPLGRGIRFAEAEKGHPNFNSIASCPCCCKESLVRYEELVEDIIFNPGQMKSIQWVTCYTCSYHIRYNVGDPFNFGLSDNKIFNYPSED